MRGDSTEAMAFELNLAQRAGIYQRGKDTLGKGNSLPRHGERRKTWQI